MICAVSFFSYRFSSLVFARENKPTPKNAIPLMEELQSNASFAARLTAAALGRTRETITYDPSYYKIPYPNGDVDAGKGVCSDVVIRSYRVLGIDLQELIHEDMKSNFRAYPQLWGLRAPDSNIDHRRVPNLQRFFMRHGQQLENSRILTDYESGDIVAWRLANGATHIGIVVPGPGEYRNEKWVVHNIGSGPVWDNCLFAYQIIGHYRYK